MKIQSFRRVAGLEFLETMQKRRESRQISSDSIFCMSGRRDRWVRINWLIDWLIDWLVGWLIGWLIDWLILFDWVIGWLTDWPTDQPTDWSIDCFAIFQDRRLMIPFDWFWLVAWFWLIDPLIDRSRLIDWLIDRSRLIDWLIAQCCSFQHSTFMILSWRIDWLISIDFGWFWLNYFDWLIDRLILIDCLFIVYLLID